MRVAQVRGVLLKAVPIVVLLAAVACGSAAAPTPTSTKPPLAPTATATTAPAPAVATPTPTRAPVVQATPTPTIAPPPATPTAAAKRGGEFVLAISGRPAGLDANVNVGGNDLIVHGPMYSSLLVFDKKGNIEPELATSWDVVDGGKRLVFHLAPNIKFSDGSPLTAEDVVWSIEKIMGKVEGHARSGRVGVLGDYIASMQAVDAQTVALQLNFASPMVPQLLAQNFAGITKKGVTAATLKQTGLGPGAFKYKEEVTGSHLVAEKNPYFFKPGLPYLDTIKYQIITDQTARFAAVVTKKVDFYREISTAPGPDLQKSLREAKGVLFLTQPADSIRIVITNMTIDTPLKDPRVRKAVDLVMDRQGWSDVVNYGLGNQGLLWPADYPKWGRPQAEVLKRPGFDNATKAKDIADAKALMSAAGFSNGFDIEWNASGASAQTDWVLLQLVQIGIRGKVKIHSSAQSDLIMIEHKYTFSTDGYTLMSGDPDEKFIGYLKTGGSRNNAGYSNPQIDSLIDQQSRELDPTKRLQLVRQIEDIVLEERPWIVLGFVPKWVINRDYVHGMEPGFSYYNDNRFDKVWVDK
ncbi:MAG: ABC transporter substrate-binding protein [Chloroflexi bacterium]|nr:ABC transporter substrate-binding protein [Chloroflexota bacterium]